MWGSSCPSSTIKHSWKSTADGHLESVTHHKNVKICHGKVITVLILCCQCEPLTKAEKIKLAPEKLREAKMRKVKSAVFKKKKRSLSSPCSYTVKENELSAFPVVDSQGADEWRQLQDIDGGRETDSSRGFGQAVWEDILWLQHRLEPVWDQPWAADWWDEHAHMLYMPSNHMQASAHSVCVY